MLKIPMAEQSVISPAQFGENLFARVFSPEAIVRQIDRSITEREIAIDMPNDPVPVGPIELPLLRVSTRGTATIAPLGLRVHGPGRFDALVNIELKPLTVAFNTGAVEMWDIEIEAALEIRLVLHAPATLRIELGVPDPAAILVSCLKANDNWSLTKGTVEAQIRATVAETLANAARDSEATRTIDLEAQIRSAMEAPAPVQVAYGDANEERTGLQLGVDGAYVYRAADGDWVLRARAGVRNGTPEKVAFGRERFGLPGWNTTSSRDGDFPAAIVLPPGVGMEGELGYFISGDRPAPRAVWFEVAGVGEVPWRRRVQVAEAPAPPIRHAPWPPVGRITFAATSAGFSWLDSTKDQSISVFLVMRNQGHAQLWIPSDFFGAYAGDHWGTFHANHSTFSEGIVVPGQSQVPLLVSWYWPNGHSLGSQVTLRLGPPKSPYQKIVLPIVPGEAMCSRA
jgi:hypothetical protein